MPTPDTEQCRQDRYAHFVEQDDNPFQNEHNSDAIEAEEATVVISGLTMETIPYDGTEAIQHEIPKRTMDPFMLYKPA